MGRVCSVCGSTKTTTYRAGIIAGHDGWYSPRKSPGERWYHDDGNGYLCHKCYHKKTYKKGFVGLMISKPYHNRLKLLRASTKEPMKFVLHRVIDYYIENRLDKYTRKELLSKIPKVR